MNRIKKYKYPIIFSFLSLAILFSFQHCGRGVISEDSNRTSILSNLLTLSGACLNSVLLGKWTSTTDNTFGLTFLDNCLYTNNFCNSTGTYPKNIISNTGTIKFNIEKLPSNAPSQCLPLGISNCQYLINESVSPHQLTVQCENIGNVYYKDPTYAYDTTCSFSSEYFPVCGSDGKTYENAGIAKCMGSIQNTPGNCQCRNDLFVCGENNRTYTECSAIKLNIRVVKYVKCDQTPM